MWVAGWEQEGRVMEGMGAEEEGVVGGSGRGRWGRRGGECGAGGYVGSRGVSLVQLSLHLLFASFVIHAEMRGLRDNHLTLLRCFLFLW